MVYLFRRLRRMEDFIRRSINRHLVDRGVENEVNKLSSRSRNKASDIIVTIEKNGYTYIYSNYLHYVPFHGAQSHKEELPGAPAGNTEPDPSQQAAEPREAEQPYSPEHT